MSFAAPRHFQRGRRLRAARPGGDSALPHNRSRPRLPGAAEALALEVTSGSRRPEGGPLAGQVRGGGGADWAGAASHFRSPAGLFIFMRWGEAGFGAWDPSPAQARAPQRGAPGFRLGEGVSSWSRLKNVSLPLLRPLVPALCDGGWGVPRKAGGVGAGAGAAPPPGRTPPRAPGQPPR